MLLVIDPTGKVRCLYAEAIPLASRIVAVCDASVEDVVTKGYRDLDFTARKRLIRRDHLGLLSKEEHALILGGCGHSQLASEAPWSPVNARAAR